MVPRVRAAAPLWADLSGNARQTILADTKQIAADQNFRPALRKLLATEGGPALVTRAFAGHPDELRALNRSLVKESLGYR